MVIDIAVIRSFETRPRGVKNASIMAEKRGFFQSQREKELEFVNCIRKMNANLQHNHENSKAI